MLCLLSCAGLAAACTQVIVTGGASVNGSHMIAYTYDSGESAWMSCVPAQDHNPGDSLTITDWNGNPTGKVAQPRHTFAVLGFKIEGLINEYQLSLGETTFAGRKELQNPEGLLNYGNLMTLTLQRAKTACEAIKVMDELTREYGYRDGGEVFSIADTKEAWVLEMIGTGKGGPKGAIWAAMKIPDGTVYVHANDARITGISRNDPENFRYSENVISFAVEEGYYIPSPDKPFNFSEAYDPLTAEKKRMNQGRIWSIIRRVAPSLNPSPDYFRDVTGAKPYPLFVKPDRKLGVADMFALMRDHYEGTEFDLTGGIDAGPFSNPNRSRPLKWKAGGSEYMWERPVSLMHTAATFVTESRAGLPDCIGGLLWWGMDDPYSTCFSPFYCGINRIPDSYTFSDYKKFSWDSAWWAFGFVGNYVNLKYSLMIKDVQAIQSEIEGRFLAYQPYLEKTALEMYGKDPELAKAFLTDYCVNNGDMVYKRWKELGEFLIMKYNDGFTRDKNNNITTIAYPEWWLKEVIKTKQNMFLQPAEKKQHE
jgi:dipeptidase